MTQVHGCCFSRNSVAEGHLYLSHSNPSFHPRFPEGLTGDVAKVALKAGRKIVRPLKQSHGAFRHNLDPISSATRRLRLIGSRSNHVQMHNAFLNNAFLQFLLYNNQESCSCNNLGVIFLQQSSLRMTRWLFPWVLFSVWNSISISGPLYVRFKLQRKTRHMRLYSNRLRCTFLQEWRVFETRQCV